MLNTIFSILILFAISSGPRPAAGKRFIYPPGTRAGGNFTPGILMDGTLYISGQAGEDRNGKIPESFEAEVKQSLDNIDAVLKEAGMTPDDVVSVQVYLTDG